MKTQFPSLQIWISVYFTQKLNSILKTSEKTMPNFLLMFSLPEQLMESMSLFNSEDSNCLIKHLEIWLTPFFSLIAQLTVWGILSKSIIETIKWALVELWPVYMYEVCTNIKYKYKCIIFFQVGRFRWAHNSKGSSAGTKVMCFSADMCFRFFV